MMTCPDCGYRCSDSDIKCHNCGFKFSGSDSYANQSNNSFCSSTGNFNVSNAISTGRLVKSVYGFSTLMHKN